MERENRYLVLKRKHIDLLTDEAKEDLENIVHAIGIARMQDIDTGAEGAVDCVVVERDWPMYEQTWEAIEEWVDSGAPTPAEFKTRYHKQRNKNEPIRGIEDD